MRKITIIIILFATACVESKPTQVVNEPENLIEPENFKQVLYEFYLVEGMFYRNDVIAFELDTLSHYHQLLFDKFNINYVDFKTSYDYYHTNPDLMNTMYEEMIQDYQVLKSKVDLLEEDDDLIDSEEGFVKDSIHVNTSVKNVRKKNEMPFKKRNRTIHTKSDQKGEKKVSN